MSIGLIRRKTENIISRNRIPIIVGGSFYYLQALLWGPDGDHNLTGEDVRGTEGCLRPAPSIKDIPNFARLEDIVKNIDPAAHTEAEVRSYMEYNNVYEFLMDLDPSEEICPCFIFSEN